MAVHGSCRSAAAIAPDRAQQLVLAEHAPGLARKMQKQLELQRAQIHRVTVDAHRVSASVDPESPNPQRPPGVTIRASPAQNRTQPCPQLEISGRT